MHKDELTGQEVIDYDFFGKGLRPPKKVRSADAGKEINRLLREMNHLFFHRHNDKKKGQLHPHGEGREEPEPAVHGEDVLRGCKEEPY